MAHKHGEFWLHSTDGPAGTRLTEWAFLDDKGNVLAQSAYPAGDAAAREAIQWIREHAAESHIPKEGEVAY